MHKSPPRPSPTPSRVRPTALDSDRPGVPGLHAGWPLGAVVASWEYATAAQGQSGTARVTERSRGLGRNNKDKPLVFALLHRTGLYRLHDLWNQLPPSLRQPHPTSDFSFPASLTSTSVVPSPLSSSITHSLLYSHLKTYLFYKSFPP